MSITISGVLYDSKSSRLSFCEVFFQSLSNTGNVVNAANKSFRTDHVGFYSQQIPFGTYRVYIRNRDSRDFYLIKDKIVIDNTTSNQTINDLLA